MTEAEISRELNRKHKANGVGSDPRYQRKAKLKMRFKGERLTREIERTDEKLTMLLEIARGE